MGSRLPPEQLSLYKRCDEILHYVWDPIGIATEPGGRDEYESYLPEVFKLLLDGASEQHIADYLSSIARDHMGLSENLEHSAHVAKVLVHARDWLMPSLH